MQKSVHIFANHPRIAQILRIFLIWGILCLNLYLQNHWNEADVLPLARQFFDRSWLPADWYLNLRPDYRILFDWMAGFFLSKFGFQTVSLFGSLCEYFCFAIALDFFYRTIQLKLPYCLAALLLFLSHQSLVAGEWMVGGLETKAFAYIFVLLSISFSIRKQPLPAFFCAGAGFSFHPLIGFYSFFCLYLGLICVTTSKQEIFRTFKHVWIFFVSGIVGLYSVFQQMSLSIADRAEQAWKIYVQIRLPHHLYPAVWIGDDWKWILLGSALFLVAVFIFNPLRGKVFLPAYTLGSICLFLAGLCIYWIGNISWLRFYWFRLADVMVPFMMPLILFGYLSHLELKQAGKNETLHALENKLSAAPKYSSAIILILVVLISLVNFVGTVQINKTQQLADQDEMSMLTWISTNTPRDSVFLADPMLSDFYLVAQRSTFCSYKHLPSYADEILIWFDRLTACNGGQSITENGIALMSELQTNFYNLSEDQIDALARKYQLSYFLGNSTSEVDYPILFTSGRYTLYKIE